MAWPRDAITWRVPDLKLFAALLCALLIGAFHLGNEGYVSTQGDMPRYLMNGVYLLDLLRDAPFATIDTFLAYSQLYYARYPALSLGHHPPLVAIAEVPVFAVFGVSVAAARLVPLIGLVASTYYLYRFLADLYDRDVALVASLLFTTSTMVVLLSQSVMSEVPTMALMLASARSLQLFCRTDRRRFLVAFTVGAILSVYGKQLAVLVFPAYAGAALAVVGWRRLLRRDVVLAVVVIIILLLPMVALTLSLSPATVADALSSTTDRTPGLLWSIGAALTGQFTYPVLMLIAAAATAAIYGRDRRAMLLALWIGGVLLGLVQPLGRYEPPRYSIYWVPALCALAGSFVGGSAGRRPTLRRICVVAALIAAIVPLVQTGASPLRGAGGYEAAAQFVLASDPGATVLFSGDVDTGYFSFFIRKHDSNRTLTVLRADKILTTSELGQVSVEERISDPLQIYDVLKRFGTKFVVVEDTRSSSRVLEWLRQECRSLRFQERQRTPIVSMDPRLKNVDLVVYEYLDAGPPDPEAVLNMHLPLVGRTLEVKLSDLIERRLLR